MPGKHKNPPADEITPADNLEAEDTLIGRAVVPNLPAKKKVKKVGAGNKKRSPRRPVTPGDKRRRPQSAPSGRSGRDLWMHALKNRQITGLASSRHAQTPRHKTACEFWVDTLRKTGSGFTTESIGMNTFNGRRPHDQEMAYLSTPSYLRQLAGTERPGKMADLTVKANPGTPAYKSPEEYYEQILEYKKQFAYMNQEAAAMKAKIRRLEEDNLKKEKAIDSLLNPCKNEELRRTLADKKPDSGAVIHSLKQKMLKLETQMRDKETSYIKLQSDLKTTKIEEMKMQMEVFYNEIVRLQNSKNTGMDKSVRGTGSEGSVKIKALNETILRLNKSNEQLQAENRSLKEDLKNVMEDTKDGSPRKDYEDMNKNELLRTVSQLKKKLERAEKQSDGSSVVSYDGNAKKTLGKIALEGSLEERLDQLDKRESELLDIIEKKTDKIKDLTDEKNRWKKRCKEQYIDSGIMIDNHDVKPEQVRKRPQSASRPPSAQSVTSKQGKQRPLSARSRSERPLSAREPPLSSRSEQAVAEKAAKEANARPPNAKRSSSIDSGISDVRKKKIQNFKEKRSAVTIQRHWRSHKDNKRIQNEKVNHFRKDLAARKIQKYWTAHQYKKYHFNEAFDIIQAALLGHSHRQQQIRGYHSDTDSMYDTDEDRSQYVKLIQSALLGHLQRKTTMRNTHISSTTGTEDDDEDDSNDVDDSEFIESSRHLSYSQRSNRPSSPSLYSARPSSARSKVSVASSKASSVHSTSRNKFGVQPLTYNYLDNDDF